jgi:hypothetical protein
VELVANPRLRGVVVYVGPSVVEVELDGGGKAVLGRDRWQLEQWGPSHE